VRLGEVVTDASRWPHPSVTVDGDGAASQRRRMSGSMTRSGLIVDFGLRCFIEEHALPGTGVEPGAFWDGLSDLVRRFAGRNAELLARRLKFQVAIDAWHIARRHDDQTNDLGPYRAFLEEIGYIVPDSGACAVDAGDLDDEIASIAGPQLVVPVSNARYALNAVNARWGSLYDALYGTDALGDPPTVGPYDPTRGRRVIERGRVFLDDAVPLAGVTHSAVCGYAIVCGRLEATLNDGRRVGLRDPKQFAGWTGAPGRPTTILLRHHGLGVELVIDPHHRVGATDEARIADIQIESAVTVIMDCEDSVAAVDAADKVGVYRNWLGLMRGDLTEVVTKDGHTFERRMADDRVVVAPTGSAITVRGRALMLVRNVGLLMTTPAVHSADGEEIPEGLLDAAVTVLCALHDLRRPGGPVNSPAGAVYVVKPKLHGPDEAQFVDDVFAHVERMFALPRNTVKVGLMDEERRTSLNLRECIRPLRGRLAFINTGFLDRTGDEIHTSMQAGAMLRKGDMRSTAWFDAYERSNVVVGIGCGLLGRGQIGKGMWAAPDLMHAMLAEKVGQLHAGASCGWVPSPTAATLHALHYHQIDVTAVQASLACDDIVELDAMLRIPVVPDSTPGVPWTDEERLTELDNNLQSILGYVVRWVDQGVGCSKVPDITGVALMEDRATCRISSQHVTNWLLHGVVTQTEVDEHLRTMAELVDQQNARDPDYLPMAPSFDGPAFRTARSLVTDGTTSPNGYTEPLLHLGRTEAKAGW
jgi:malate synthase